MTEEELKELMKSKGFESNFWNYEELTDFVNHSTISAIVIHQDFKTKLYTPEVYIRDHWIHGKEYFDNKTKAFLKGLETYEESLDL